MARTPRQIELRPDHEIPDEREVPEAPQGIAPPAGAYLLPSLARLRPTAEEGGGRLPAAVHDEIDFNPRDSMADFSVRVRAHDAGLVSANTVMQAMTRAMGIPAALLQPALATRPNSPPIVVVH